MTLAFEIMLDKELNKDIPLEIFVEVSFKLAKRAGFNGMVGGQYADIINENKMIDFDTLNFIHRHKTAALISYCCELGAILGFAEEKDKQNLAIFGEKIGLAFQIIDDIIGIWETETGKPKASDIRNKKKTLPVLYAFEKAPEEKRRILQEKYQKEVMDEEDINQVMEVLEEVEAHEYCKKVAKDYEDDALQELEETGIENEAIDELKALASFLVKRKY